MPAPRAHYSGNYSTNILPVLSQKSYTGGGRVNQTFAHGQVIFTDSSNSNYGKNENSKANNFTQVIGKILKSQNTINKENESVVKKRINIQRVHQTPITNFIKNRFENKQIYRKKSPLKKSQKTVPCARINCVETSAKSLSSSRVTGGIYQTSARTHRAKRADISIVGVIKPKSRP